MLRLLSLVVFFIGVSYATIAWATTHMSAGASTTCALDDGTLTCWGDNSFNQYGISSTAASFAPHATGMAGSITSVSASDQVCAVKGGTVSCWGWNAYGQTGATTAHNPTTAPTAITSLANVTQVAVSGTHACALLASGAVWCWGDNEAGELGNNSQTSTHTPVQAMASGATFIAVGGQHSCALMSDTSVKCWGDDEGGTNVGPGYSKTPHVVPGLSSGVTLLATGAYHSCVVVSGVARCWGSNARGQLGDSTLTDHSTPAALTGLASADSFALGTGHSCATLNGAAYCWGANDAGELGLGTTTDATVPTQVVGMLSGVNELTVGGEHTCARTNASISCWGANESLQLGHALNVGTNATLPWPVESRSACTATNCAVAPAGQTLFAGGNDACVLDGGQLRCWGDNYSHELLDGTTADPSTATVVDGAASGIQSVAIGDGFLCTLSSTGVVGCRGDNSFGMIGNGASTYQTAFYPAYVIAGLHPVEIAAGNSHVCAVLADSSVWCWGYNISGQLGDNTTVQRDSPVRALAAGAKHLVLGDSTHTCALMNNSSLECWGQYTGAYFDPLHTDSHVPHVVPGLESGVTVLGSGAGHSCVMVSGVAQCWGWNAFGQIADGTEVEGEETQLPSNVLPLGLNFDSLALGIMHSCGLIGHDVYCWGANNYGQLGDGTRDNRVAPTLVASLQGQAREIAAGGYYTCARTNTSVQCWGDDSYDQLGNLNYIGIDPTRPFPVTGTTVCLPLTCTAVGGSCGIFSDGCGGTINCGTCTAGSQSSCFSTTLLASENYANAQSQDGAQTFTDAMQILVPSQINVTQGATSTGSVTAAYQNGAGTLVTCTYNGSASHPNKYTFTSCSNGTAANALVSATSFHLHVVSGDNTAGPTTVIWPIEAQPCGCTATTCAALSATCGVLTDGCGGLLNCGACSGTNTCGGNASAPLTCGCTPTTCAGSGAQCGTLADGCGGSLDCGSCAAPETCGASGVANRCDCVPRTCAAASASCGMTDDGCGGELDCGDCSSPQTCGGGGTPKTCGCTPLVCSAYSLVCGAIADGCGSMISCGTCSGNLVCDEHGACNLPEIFTTTDPEVPGAAVYVPGGIATNYTATAVPPSEGETRVVGGTTLVTAGDAVKYEAVGYTGSEYFFPAASQCAQLVVPFDPMIEELGGEVLASLKVYQVLDLGAFSAITVAQSLNLAAHTVSFCTLHLSTYVVVYSLPCSIPAAATVQANTANRYPDIAGSSILREPPLDFAAPPNVTADLVSGGLLSGTATYVFAYGSDKFDIACFYRGALSGSSTSLGSRSCYALQVQGGRAFAPEAGGTTGGGDCGDKTCDNQGYECGSYANGCTTLDCGTCASGTTCVLHHCCAMPTCGSRVCGQVSNSCGTVTCGPACPTCTPETCATLGVGCGSGFSDGCGGLLNCGSCSGVNTCGGGGTPSQCGCTAKTCAQLGCGTPSDSCGHTLNCGCDQVPQTCGGDGQTSVCGFPGLVIDGVTYTLNGPPTTPAEQSANMFVLALNDFVPANSNTFSFRGSYKIPSYRRECVPSATGMCGSIPNGCGQMIMCGCADGAQCGVVVANQCGTVPTSKCAGTAINTDPCTADVCVGGVVHSTRQIDGTLCGALDPCNGIARCMKGRCSVLLHLTRSGDTDSCVVESCNPTTGALSFARAASCSGTAASCIASPTAVRPAITSDLSSLFSAQSAGAITNLKQHCTTATCSTVLQ